MEPANESKEKLVADIMKDAEAEAARIREEAERQVRERRAQIERQEAAIRAEAVAAASAQAEAVKNSLTAALAVELKRITLRSRERVFKRILERVEERLAERIGRPDYRNVLLTLIVEAAIGLGAERMEVNASAAERALIDDGLLREAEAVVKKLVLRTVSFKKSDAAPLLLQGVVVSAADGKTAYNNQIRTRLMRNQGAVRKLMYDRLKL